MRRFNTQEIFDADDDLGAVASNGHGNENGHTTHQEDNDDTEAIGISLPHSTHSLLFTEPVCSFPFWFAVIIALMSFFVMMLALINNISGDGNDDRNVYQVPVNVSPAVKGSQYLALLVTLLMEEEIPTGIYLLRRIKKDSLKMSNISHRKFVFSSIVRIVLGYTFLINAFLVIAQSNRVLDIFYDMLALEFVESLDDISFTLATMDVFGKRMRRATLKMCFRAEFPRRYGRGKRFSIVLKALYFFNLLVLISLLTTISVRQSQGYYNCDSITLTFGNDIWEDAVVIGERGYETMLVYSFFNGVYEQNGTQDGRPIYVERNKYNNGDFGNKVGAEIKYCRSLQAWVITHEHIRKTSTDDSDCPWLLKAHSFEYDLLNVPSDSWAVWVGSIQHAEVSIFNNVCHENVDCNLNGQCIDGKCECYSSDDSVEFFGLHCEYKLKEQCKTIQGQDNQTWSVVPVSDDKLFTTYGRPLYSLNGISNEKYNLTKDDAVHLLFVGARWMVMVFRGLKVTGLGQWEEAASMFHPFWSYNYTHNEENFTIAVSDPTTESTPVGVDFYEIGEQGEQYGPFGILYPMQNPPGRGYFHCIGS